MELPGTPSRNSDIFDAPRHFTSFSSRSSRALLLAPRLPARILRIHFPHLTRKTREIFLHYTPQKSRFGRFSGADCNSGFGKTARSWNFAGISIQILSIDFFPFFAPRSIEKSLCAHPPRHFSILHLPRLVLLRSARALGPLFRKAMETGHSEKPIVGFFAFCALRGRERGASLCPSDPKQKCFASGAHTEIFLSGAEHEVRNGRTRNFELAGVRSQNSERESFPLRHSFLRENFGKVRKNLSMVVPRTVIVIETWENSKNRGQKVRVDKIHWQIRGQKVRVDKIPVT